ncbi:MAG: hypothetical protein WC384_06050 [Prolixibacteraceae bacterium]|jgi:hypothetical protein
MDDYIFLIIAVVISIFAAIKKNKKKEDLVSPDSAVQSKPRNYLIDQLLGDDFLAEPEEDIEPPVMPKQVLKREPLVVATPAWTPVNYKSTFKSSLPDRSSKIIQTKTTRNLPEVIQDIEGTGEETSYLEDFSLRKAVIYSEIMNRKYT